jgi:hypothetical protein
MRTNFIFASNSSEEDLIHSVCAIIEMVALYVVLYWKFSFININGSAAKQNKLQIYRSGKQSFFSESHEWHGMGIFSPAHVPRQTNIHFAANN